jgi:MoxR-like ATPase
MNQTIETTDSPRMTQAADLIQPKPPASAALSVSQAEGFVQTAQVERVASRAAVYIEAGYPVHLAGPAGTGKTTLAFHVAAMRGRPVSLMHGNEAFNGTDLVGAGLRIQEVDNR